MNCRAHKGRGKEARGARTGIEGKQAMSKSPAGIGFVGCAFSPAAAEGGRAVGSKPHSHSHGRRREVVVKGNRDTRRALEQAGVQVLEYEGAEISVKGAGGPTCLTRPLMRERP